MNWIREQLSRNPWLGWIVAAIALSISVYLLVRGGVGGSPYSPERMQEMVTVKFTDTGDEIQMLRGELDRELRSREEGLDPSKGLRNPKTGQLTGFPYDKEDWEGMFRRISKQRDAVRAAGKAKSGPSSNSGVAPFAPPAPTAPTAPAAK